MKNRASVLKKLQTARMYQNSYNPKFKGGCVELDDYSVAYFNSYMIFVDYRREGEESGFEKFNNKEGNGYYISEIINNYDKHKIDRVPLIIDRETVENACKCKRKAKNKKEFRVVFFSCFTGKAVTAFNPDYLKHMMDWTGVKPSGNAVLEINRSNRHDFLKMWNSEEPMYTAYGLPINQEKITYEEEAEKSDFFAVFMKFDKWNEVFRVESAFESLADDHQAIPF